MPHQAVLLSIAPRIDDAAHLDGTELARQSGQNSGNHAFVHAVDQQLGGNLPRVPRARAFDANDAPEKVAVLPSANHLGEHTDLEGEAKIFARVTKPMVSIGLGAQGNSKMDVLPELAEGSVRWPQTLAEHAPSDAPNISVRGDFTFRLLEKYGFADRAVTLGCPSLFIGPAGIGQSIGKVAERPIRRVAALSGHYRWGHMRRLENSLARIVEETHGAHVEQSPVEMYRAYRGEWDTLTDEQIDMLALAVFGENVETSVLRDWYHQYSTMFFDIPAWMNYYRSFDFVVGPRIHGVMIALQAGVPALCVAHDSRTVELCETMNIPFVRLQDVRNGVTLADLPRLFERFDADVFDARRAELGAKYQEFLAGNGLVGNLPV